MITLILLHPLQSIPVQSWTFESESVVRIGRSADNEVVLYSAVVSRHHVEVRLNESGWQVISLGANGTYIDGKPIAKTPVVDGMVIRLASSGPKIQIRIGANQGDGKGKNATTKQAEAPGTASAAKPTFITSVPENNVDEHTAIDVISSLPGGH